MNIADIIIEQHREFEELMDQVAGTTADDPEERMWLFHHTRSRLRSHGRAEERVMFPRMEEDERTRPAALEAREWHSASTAVMKELMRTDPGDELWLPKWGVVRGIILAHIDAEEQRALARLREVFPEQELERMGRDFRRAEEAVLAEARAR